jgi:hypothetical protein
MYDNDKERVGHDATDFAAFGLSDPFRGYAKRNNNNKTDTDSIDFDHVKFVTDVWEVLDGAGNLLIKKHKDYGPTNISLSPGGPLNGLRVRMHDKTARINHLIDSGATPENESLRDSFIDLLNYSAIALMVLDGKWPSE